MNEDRFEVLCADGEVEYFAIDDMIEPEVESVVLLEAEEHAGFVVTRRRLLLNFSMS